MSKKIRYMRYSNEPGYKYLGSHKRRDFDVITSTNDLGNFQDYLFKMMDAFKDRIKENYELSEV